MQGHPAPASGKPDMIADNPLRHSCLNYARQTQALWSGFDKPATIGECGWDHTFHETSTPGYREMYHNAIWAGLANGLSATPFWWAYGPYINSSVVGPSMLYFSMFVRDIGFAGASWSPLELKVSGGDGWAMRGEALTFGWAANPVNGVANETFTIAGLDDGEYDVHFYRTWRGLYLDPMPATSSGGAMTVTIPELRNRGGRVQNIGNDVAFRIVRKGRGLESPVTTSLD